VFQKDNPDFDYLYLNIRELADRNLNDDAFQQRVTLELDTRIFTDEFD